MLLIGGTFIILLSVIITSNVISIGSGMEKTKRQIRESLIAKGKLLTKNNSQAMKVMAQDNAFTAIQGLVASTVADDDDLVYGIYMDRDLKAWVIADAENPAGIPKDYKPLSDSVALWAGSLSMPSHKEYPHDSISVIEFAAPVGDSADILGYIRYGISTASMKYMIDESLSAARRGMLQSMIIIVLTGLISVTIGFLVLRQLASRITMPIGALAESSRIIAEGNYDVAVVPQSNDEIGRLAEHFESMRKTIKKYTDHLQVLIDEKMQQVKDILNNIDQGLFTVNLDGTVNNEYSVRANEILQVDDVANCTLRELLRCNSEIEAAFKSWFALVRKQYKRVRWMKLARLAPVQELELKGPNGEEYVSIDYQRICDKNGNLVKIMVLALDETEKRNRDLQMEEERRKHEYDVKTILSIAHTPAEELTEFMVDTATRLREVRAEVSRHLAGVTRHRDHYPDSMEYSITREQVDRMYRDLHTIKGNSGSYDFELLSTLAHRAEGQLEQLREKMLDRRDIVLSTVDRLLTEMSGSIDDIHRKMKLIFGSEEELSVRIPEVQVSRIVTLGTSVHSSAVDPQVRQLADACIRLSWKPAKSLFRKYQKLALKSARKLLKNITVTVSDENVLYPSDFLADLDEVFIHLVRNAVAHGIETSEIRDELEKGIGHISMGIQCRNGRKIISLSDDGHGIDIDKLVERAIGSGIITREEAEVLPDEDKLNLVFRGGVTTSEELSDVSGRGMGMQIVQKKVERMGGTLEIATKFGKGTTITVSLPESSDTGEGRKEIL